MSDSLDIHNLCPHFRFQPYLPLVGKQIKAIHDLEFL